MISADVSASAAYVGGIAGYAADISDSSATCVLIDVVAFDACVGGIAGQVINSVTNSDATGDSAVLSRQVNASLRRFGR